MSRMSNSQFAWSLRQSDAVGDAKQEANIGLAAGHPSSKATDLFSGSPRQLLSVQ